MTVYKAVGKNETLVERVSPFSGKVNQMVVPCSTQEIADYLKSDKLIQVALPQLNAEQREFIMTGITPEEWNETFKVDSDD